MQDCNEGDDNPGSEFLKAPRYRLPQSELLKKGLIAAFQRASIRRH